MGTLLSFSTTAVLCTIFPRYAYALSVEVLTANGNTVEDQSEDNVINLNLTWTNSEPVALNVRLTPGDAASTLMLAGLIENHSKDKWRGFRIELGKGVTWGRTLDTVSEPWQVSYIWFYPGGKHLFVREDATSATLGFKTPVRQIAIGNEKRFRNDEIASGRAPWLSSQTESSDWVIDRSNLELGDSFSIRLVPLVKHPPVCLAIEKPRWPHGDIYCVNDQFGRP